MIKLAAVHMLALNVLRSRSQLSASSRHKARKHKKIRRVVFSGFVSV